MTAAVSVTAGLPLRFPVAGDVWAWREPSGAWRTMFVRSLRATNGCVRAFGVKPGTKRQLQRLASSLARGLDGAVLLSEDPSFVFVPKVSRCGRLKSKDFYR